MGVNPLRRLLTFGAPAPAWEEAPPKQLYDVLWSYYHSNDLYSNVQVGLRNAGVSAESMLPLRNPAFRVAEFYVSKLWTTKQEILAPMEQILEPIDRVWRWSNWTNKRRLAARQFAVLGDMFIKVVAREDRTRVYFQLIDPVNMTDFAVDERGFIVWCRMDVPITMQNGNGGWHTEVWNKSEVRVWQHTKGAGESTDRLGAPMMQLSSGELGIDFVPIVHAKFRDVGNDRGQGAYTHALDKIDEANRMATRLHKLLYRYNSAMWVLSANGVDSSNRPLPPPALSNSAGKGVDDQLTIGDDRVFRVPGQATLAPLDNKVDFDASLKVLQDHMLELEKDLPELAYYQLRQMTDVSGRAIQLLLSDAIDRVLEARSAAEFAVIRANQMALTMGAAIGLFKLEGSYDSGAFEHDFAPEDVIPLSAAEVATAEKTEAEAKAAKLGLGVSQTQVLKELGYTEEDIIQFEVDRQTEAAAATAQFDAGTFAQTGAGAQG